MISSITPYTVYPIPGGGLGRGHVHQLQGLGRASWQGTQGLPPPPRHLDGLSARPVASVSRRPHEVGRIEGLGLDALEVAERASRSLPKATAKLNCTIGDRAGELVAQGSIIQCRRARRPGPASAASRSLQKIVGGIVGRCLELGANTYRVLVPPTPPIGP